MEAITPFSVCACGLVLALSVIGMVLVVRHGRAFPRCSRCGAFLDCDHAPRLAICSECALDNPMAPPPCAEPPAPAPRCPDCNTKLVYEDERNLDGYIIHAWLECPNHCGYHETIPCS